VALAVRPQIGTIVPANEEGTNPVVRVGELGGPSVCIERCGRVTLSNAEQDRFALHAGDFLLARAIGSEEHLGKASIVPELSAPAVFDSHVMRLRFKGACMHPTFFYFWLRTRGGRALFMEKAGRTAVQFNINSVQIQDIDIPLPPIAQQRAFTEIAAKLQCTASRLKRQLVLCSLASASVRAVALEQAS
jgi:type I restriction enzyme S subunit